jgi:hypothetical protein
VWTADVVVPKGNCDLRLSEQTQRPTVLHGLYTCCVILLPRCYSFEEKNLLET